MQDGKAPPLAGLFRAKLTLQAGVSAWDMKQIKHVPPWLTRPDSLLARVLAGC